jgi:hypothetical protein
VSPSNSPAPAGAVFFVIYPQPSAAPTQNSTCPDPVPPECVCGHAGEYCNSGKIISQGSGTGQDSGNGKLVYTNVNANLEVFPPHAADSYVAAPYILARGWFTAGFVADATGATTMAATMISYGPDPDTGCCTQVTPNRYVTLTFGDLQSQIDAPACGSGTGSDPYRIFMPGGVESRPCA